MMKHFFTFFSRLSCLAAMIFILASCDMDDKADEAVPRLHISQVNYEVTLPGTLKDGTAATLRVTANKGYEITSDQTWLTVDKPSGTGLTDVTILCESNTSGAVRTGTLTITSHELSEQVHVTQTLYDPSAVVDLRTFFSDDFSWTEPIAAANNLKDPVGDPDNGYTRMQITDSRVATAWTATGLSDWYKTTVDASAANKINIQNGYLNFNSNAYFNTGLILPAISTNDGETANATLSFSASPDAGKNGADNVPLVVEIISGPGTVNGQSSVEITLPSERAWADYSYELDDITSETRIAIHTNAPSSQHYCRWYIDNLLLKETR